MKNKEQATWCARATAALAILAATAVALPAQTLTTLVNFDGANGSNSYASVVQGGDGNLYGTTFYGGANGRGTAFKLSPTGTVTTLYSFCAQNNCTDGSSPSAGLVLAKDGDFYGTATFSGANNGGTLFKITSGGVLTTLYSFCALSNCADGWNPFTAGLVQGTDENLYGITEFGGASTACGTYGCGTVFKITREGTLTTLHSFDDTDGRNPEGLLVQGRDGNFYGTTVLGGAYGNCPENSHCGTVFKITPSGTLTTLYSFCALTNCADGDEPYAGLVQAADGNLYGTTAYGGTGTIGTVFKITVTGALTTLHSFDFPDGAYPYARLVQATDGDLYGTTSGGGAGDGGTVFKITSAGTLTRLYSFCAQNCADGSDPQAGLIQATDGNFYGTTYSGGTNNDGTVFSVALGLGPFVETLPTLGPVGAPVRILGTNLAGATSVTFNGTAATFTVNSTGTAINTTVPSGATTGTVQVVTPGGTLSSNVPFRVRH